MEYYLIRCIYRREEFFSVWYTDDIDGLCSIGKKILSFPGMDSARQYSSSEKISLNTNDVPAYDFDKLKNWLDSRSNEVDCKQMLDFWNIFTDAAATTGSAYAGDRKTKNTNLIYDKLFFGCNWAFFKQDHDDDYVPVWDKKQIRSMKSILKNGLNLFVENLTAYAAA